MGFAGFALAETIDPGEPPALLFHGTNDPTVPFALGRGTGDALVAAGITCDFVAHDDGRWIAPNVDDAINRTDAFLRRELG